MPHSKLKIVIVDDDPGMNKAIARLLNAAGFAPVPFPSAEALLESGGDAGAACLVLDVHLPGISGFELRRRLKRAGSMTPVIFITAYDDPASQEQAQDAGAVALFRKPFTGRSLITAINRAEGATSEESQ
jgi:FixJ family two-component response regulator